MHRLLQLVPLFVFVSPVVAQERRSGPINELPPAQEAEKLPPPKSQAMPAPRSVPMQVPPELMRFERYAGPQVGRRNVWELLIPDGRGYFVDRVIAAPPVPYYLYNGQPYPWTTTSSLPYMSYATD